MTYFTQDYNKDEKIIEPNDAQNCTSCGKVFLPYNSIIAIKNIVKILKNNQE